MVKNTKLDEHAKELFNDINNGNKNNFFQTKYVFVPSIKMADYLKAYFLKNNNVILMNVKFVSIRSGLYSLYDTNLKLASKSQIRALIIKYLSKNEVTELKAYLDGDLRSIKIYDTANELASLFMQYEDDLFNITGYQSDIYKYVIDELKKNEYTTLKSLFSDSNSCFNNALPIYIFGFLKYTNLEKEIINKLTNKHEYMLDTSSINVTHNKISKIYAAPSRLREIEQLHTDICNKLKDKNTSFSDFLVLSTDIESYEVAVKRVFNQTDYNFPNIPYYFDSKSAVDNSTYNLVSLLFDICNKGYFNRSDFMDLVSNPITRKINELDDDNINSVINAILKLNIYREIDWDYLKLRLLTSKFSDINDDNDVVSYTNLDFDKSIPYQAIGLDDSLIVCVIQWIDNLNSIIKLIEKDTLDDAFFEAFKEELSKWLSVKEYGQETNSYLVKMIDIIDYWKNNEIHKVSVKDLLYDIIEVCKKSSSDKGSLYSSGVSFAKLDNKNVLAAKYVYIIGASSEFLPIKKNKSPFDLRGNDVSYEEERDVFKLSLINSENEVFVSYVNRSLKTDAEYFLSNFVKELYQADSTINKLDDYLKKHTTVLNIDETRNWNELYTKKEFENKKYNHNLVCDSKDKIINDSNHNKGVTPGSSNQNIVKSIKVTKIGSFLNEPLMYKAMNLFKNDDTNKEFNNVFEPLSVNSLARYNIFEEMVIRYITIENGINYKEEKERFSLENKLPRLNDNIKDKEFKEIFNKVEPFVNKISNKKEALELLLLPDYKLDNCTFIDDRQCIRFCNGVERNYYSIKEACKDKDNFILFGIALMDIASEKDDGTNYKIRLNNAIVLNNITPLAARNRLKELAEAMNNYDDIKAIPCTIDENEGVELDYYDYKDALEKLWIYFESKNLFDLYSQLGYDFIGFDEELLLDDLKKQKQFLKFETKED